MTLFCPLNQPQCKRSIMTSSGPFQKNECPLSKGRKCPFAPAVCPALRPSDDECYWPKIQGVMDQGGCKVKPNPMSQLAAQCCKVQKAQFQNPDGQKSYPPANCAELPPCNRCSFGHPKDIESKEKTKKMKKNGSVSPNKEEDTKQFASPGVGRNPPLLSRTSRQAGGETCRDRIQNKETNVSRFNSLVAKVQKAAQKTRTVADNKVEDVKVQKRSNHLLKNRLEETKQQATAPEKREEIFRSAIYDKMGKLQTREHLMVPQCSSASRRIMPCTTCLVDLLGTTAETSYGDRTGDHTGNRTGVERCHIQRILTTCTAFRVPSVCPGGCPCLDVPPMEEDDCPFLRHQLPPTRGCPLGRLPDHPLVLGPGRKSIPGANFDPCKCPIIPGDCCYTLPGCPVHTMRAVHDCPNRNRNCR